MAGPTIHQRVHGHLWHWKTGPGWWRNPSELVQLRQSGLRVLRVQLQDDGPIPADLVAGWRNAGFKVWGWIRPSGAPLAPSGTVWTPEQTAEWFRAERVRLSLTGIDANFEDEIKAQDVATGGQWSERFCKRFRELCPTLPAHLDSYWGPMGSGINLGAYKARGFRFSVQTYWADGVWNDSVTNIVAKGAGAQPRIDKSIIKPVIRISRNNQGQQVDAEVAIADMKAAGTIGVSYYPLDAQSDWHTLNLLPKAAIVSGVAY